jgi:hypothetical protein
MRWGRWVGVWFWQKQIRAPLVLEKKVCLAEVLE